MNGTLKRNGNVTALYLKTAEKIAEKKGINWEKLIEEITPSFTVGADQSCTPPENKLIWKFPKQANGNTLEVSDRQLKRHLQQSLADKMLFWDVDSKPKTGATMSEKELVLFSDQTGESHVIELPLTEDTLVSTVILIYTNDK